MRKSLITLLLLLLIPSVQAEKQIPDVLKPWQDWVLWNEDNRGTPSTYDNQNLRLPFWPSRLTLDLHHLGGRLEMGLTVFRKTWVPLPGQEASWPLSVQANGTSVPVVLHQGRPSILLEPGTYRLAGLYKWDDLPSSIPLPEEIGVLSLTLEGKKVESPTWNAGQLWLKRTRNTETTDKDSLTVHVYRLIEDGIPMWLRTNIELSVSGKSREVELGSVLPEGWKLSLVTSPLPTAVDEQGRIKIQVRAGKWLIWLNAFRTTSPTEFHYPAGAKPATSDELIGFQADPTLRMVEITGIPNIDVSQTTFPNQWRSFPVYRWENATPFKLEEKMRGMGLQKPQGLSIQRNFWLSEDGSNLSFRDLIHGQGQRLWRLDAAAGEDLGSVRMNGVGQLITYNPQDNSPGVEIRTRSLNLEATGRVPRANALSATGWKTDADGVSAILNLPPGWRLFALFGPDYVNGDWLTAWSLLDLFLLLIFSLAVYRLWGIQAGALAFFAFALAYHEPDAPRYIWLILLIPIALLRVVPQGWGHMLVTAFKYVVILALVILLVPFVAQQIQQAIYPQLEEPTSFAAVQSMPMNAPAPMEIPASSSVEEQVEANAMVASKPQEKSKVRRAVADAFSSVSKDESGKNSDGYSSDSFSWNLRKSNLLQESKAKIQTGPAMPEWTWRTATFGWNGPVQATQKVYPILIPMWFERVLTIIRVALLILLAAVLLDASRWQIPWFQWRLRGTAFGFSLLLLMAGITSSAQAEMPTQEMLNTLRQRLLETPDAYPSAADIPSVSLTLRNQTLSYDAEIHAILRTAVPLPGALAPWSPITVTVDGKAEAPLLRRDGFLWIALEPGVHRVHVEGLLLYASEWSWSFRLQPRHVTIDAPDWTVSGVQPDGTPSQQVFFAKKQKTVAGEAGYDRQDYQTVAWAERTLELGLVWQVHNRVTRYVSNGKAISLKIPLLPGEKVLSSNAVVKDGAIEVNIGAYEQSTAWESELPITPGLTLETRKDDTWVERWQLITSPVWNVSLSGLPPIFEEQTRDLIPVWRPWPGEKVELTINRPKAIEGATVTVRNVSHSIQLGHRQRTTDMTLSLQCSLGEDFLIDVPQEADITLLEYNNRQIPVRKNGEKLVIPLQPGEQTIHIQWQTHVNLGLVTKADAVRLPVESANISTTMHLPESRWTLWTYGPLRGPAVRFWGILICSILAAWLLSRLTFSPLKAGAWLLLLVGLTQVDLACAGVVIAWFFFLAWRGSESYQKLPAWVYNLLQLALIILTIATLVIFFNVVSHGLLGGPEMFITGNDSNSSFLNWYQARAANSLPQPICLSVSIWWYRFLMLLWALWLASSLLHWLKWGWNQFSTGNILRPLWAGKPTPPPLPPKE